MNIVIGGGGKVGAVLCADLALSGHDLILVDARADVLDRLIDSNDISGIVGNLASYDVLVDAGVPECDLFIAVTSSDEVNIIASIIARKLGAGYTIARVRNPEYSAHINFVRESLGISMMINPELEAAREIAKLVKFPSALSFESFANGRVNLVEVKIEPGCELDGVNLIDFRKRFRSLIVCAVQREDEVYIPKGSFTLRAGDHLQVTGLVPDLDDLYRIVGSYNGKIRSLLIVGGGKLTHYICQQLQRSHIKLRIIEQDHDRAVELATEFPKITVVEGDGTDYQVLDEQRFNSFDAIVALTGVDEENILIGMYAARNGVPRIFTKVNRTQMLAIVGDVGLQTIITPKRIIADRLLRFARAHDNALGSNIESLYRVLNNQVEALEFCVRKGSRVIGIPLRDLNVKESLLIAFIIRQGEVIFPSGYDEIHLEDHIIVVTTEKNFDDVDDILAD